MFEISKEVIKQFSDLGVIHKKIYESWNNSLIKFNRYQKYSDYGYIHKRILSL